MRGIVVIYLGDVAPSYNEVRIILFEGRKTGETGTIFERVNHGDNWGNGGVNSSTWPLCWPGAPRIRPRLKFSPGRRRRASSDLALEDEIGRLHVLVVVICFTNLGRKQIAEDASRVPPKVSTRHQSAPWSTDPIVCCAIQQRSSKLENFSKSRPRADE